MPLAVADRHQPASQPGHHRVPRLHADDADVRLPAADRAVLRHRPQRRGRVDPHLRAAADHPDRRLRHPRGVGDDHRGHRLGRPDRTGSGCSRCSSRWPARRSSSGSTRRPWRRSRWPPWRRSSTARASASRCSPACGSTTSAQAFVPGALIVVMAVMLDRTTTAASERAEKVARGGGGDPRLRRILLVGGGRGDPRRDLPLAHLHGPGGVPGRTPSATRSRRPSATPSTGSPTPSAA